jgi:hypothetical protein
MLERMGSPVKQKTTATGHIFYVNKIADGIAKVFLTSLINSSCTNEEQDFSNLLTSQHLQLYPFETNGHVSQVWNASGS